MRTILWNKLAVQDYNNNIDFLLDKWSVNEAQTFINEVNEIIHVLKLGKVEYQSTDYAGIKRCVLRKQITLFYKTVDNETIELLRFWNTYQDNKKLKITIDR